MSAAFIGPAMLSGSMTPGAHAADRGVWAGSTWPSARLTTASKPVATERASQLNGLFAELKAQTHPGLAQVTAQKIWQIWLSPINERSSELMAQGSAAMRTGNLRDAIAIFSELIEHDPDYAEGWNKRATVWFYLGNDELSQADIDETLKREPRHFGALSGLAMIHLRQGRNQAAVDAARAAQRVYPLIPSAPRIFEQAGGSNRPEPI